MAKSADRNPDSAPGDWFIDRTCIDCAAAREAAPGLIVHRGGKSVFARQPETEEEERAAWRAVLVCPTASVGTESHRKPPEGLFPQELAPGVYRCGYNARSSFGAHSYFIRCGQRNLLVDSPRYASKLVHALQDLGGIHDILLTHRDDVADANRYAERFQCRVWIHEHDASAAPYATDILRGTEVSELGNGAIAIPVPGHTRGSVVYLFDSTYLFTGDSLAWSPGRRELVAFRDACWYSWEELKRSLARLLAYRFEWVLAGHGHSVQLSAEAMRARLEALLPRM